MRLKAIRDSFHSQALKSRQLDRIISSDDFTIAYSNATDNEKKVVEQAIFRLDKTYVIEFVKKQLMHLTPFHQMGLKMLRDIGRNLSIPKYWEKDKISLIKEIENVVARIKKSGK